MMNKIYLNVVFNSDMLNLAFKDELYHDHWLFICFVLIVSSIWQNLSVDWEVIVRPPLPIPTVIATERKSENIFLFLLMRS